MDNLFKGTFVKNKEYDILPNSNKKFNIFNILTFFDLDKKTQNILSKAINKWESIILNTYNSSKIYINIIFKKLDENILGGTTLDKVYLPFNDKIIDYQQNIFNLIYLNLGTVIAKEGTIILNNNIWNKLNESYKYYTLVHEIGHAIGIGSLWYLKNGLIFSNQFQPFYDGENANNEYNKYFPDSLKLPVENNGGAGTALVHSEEGNHHDYSFNNRNFYGVHSPGLDNELMTGWIEKENVRQPLSTISVAFLDDLGYSVNYNNAEIFKNKKPNKSRVFHRICSFYESNQNKGIFIQTKIFNKNFVTSKFKLYFNDDNYILLDTKYTGSKNNFKLRINEKNTNVNYFTNKFIYISMNDENVYFKIK